MVEHLIQSEGDGSTPVSPLQLPDLTLEYCKSTDPRYLKVRANHYVVSRGVYGQQVHFLIRYKSKIVGIISGCSPVYTTALRDRFFGMKTETREKLLNGIVNNLLFRLEVHKKNLATMVMALWRRAVVHVWEDLYGVKVFGFETLVDQEREGGGQRPGNLYKADNWTVLGETAGNTKHHGSEGLTGGIKGTPHQRRNVPRKLVFCRWVDNKLPLSAPSDYFSSWRAETAEERERAKVLAKKRKGYLGSIFFLIGKKLHRRK